MQSIKVEASSENTTQLHPDAQMLADERCTVLRRPVATRQCVVDGSSYGHRIHGSK